MLTNEKLKRHLANFPVRQDINVDIICGPTAIGKHTIVNQLQSTHKFLVPTTTRPPLRDEISGINYDKDAPAGERKHTCVIEKYQV